MVKDVKLIVSDLDGTILQSGGLMTDYSNKIIGELHHEGIEFVPSSSRGYYDIPKELLKDNIHYVSSSNGAVIMDNFTKKIIHEDYLDNLEVESILDRVGDRFPYWTLCCDDNYYCNYKIKEDIDMELGFCDDEIEDIKNNREVISDYHEFLKSSHRHVAKIHFVLSKGKGIPLLKEELTNFGGLEISSSWWENLEVQKKGVNKGHGVNIIRKMLGLKKEEVMAFGDQENDVSMFIEAGYSGAVSNAVDSLKAEATVVVGSCYEDGVCHYIEDNILKQK